MLPIVRKINIYLITGDADQETIIISDLLRDIIDNKRYTINLNDNIIEIDDDCMYQLYKYLDPIEALFIMMKYFTANNVKYKDFRYTNKGNSISVYF